MQRHATKLLADEAKQLSFLPGEKFISRPMVLDRIYGLSNTNEAIEYACELSRTADGEAIVPKRIAPQVGVHTGTWSRILSGEYDLDGRDILHFDRTVGNDVYLFYLNHIHGYDLTTLHKVAANDLERENAELRSENGDLRKTIRHLIEAQKGKG